MSVYIIFISIIIMFIIFYNTTYNEILKQKGWIVVIILMYFLFALRAPSVGRDTIAYEVAYNWTKHIDFFNFKYIYFETGFVLLMKISCILGLNFHMFMAIASLIIIIPVFYYIYKYSDNPFYSLLVFSCYMFLEFNLSAMRQAIAASICLLAFMCFIDEKKYSIIKFIILVILASTVHTGALICLLLIPLYYIKNLSNYIIILILISVIILFYRKSILSFLKGYFVKNTMNVNASIAIGGNLFFILMFGIYIIYIAYVFNSNINQDNSDIITKKMYIQKNIFKKNLHIFLLGIPALLLFGEDNSVRSSMILTQSIIILIPNSFMGFKYRDRQIVTLIMTAFLLFFFFYNTLYKNNLDIVPYKFFWNYKK